MSNTKYGNDNYWCFLDDNIKSRDIAIWKGPEGQEIIIATAFDKYEAKTIIDALLQYSKTVDDKQLSKKEMVFLEFVCANCIEPYATMASNAILWRDKTVYETLKTKFPEIY